MEADYDEPKEPIAIIGMACRFPGGAHSPEQFFENLEAGKSAWCEFPSDRLNIDGFYHPSPQRHDSFNFKGAHFLTGNIAAFDAEFFSMSASESNSTDVQQRILLEVAYEAVENAGIPKETLAGTDASVYIGSFVKDYEQVSMRDAQFLAADCATGNGIAIMSNRISYFFDIHGPSMTIDTGCSASLICLHQAVQSLQNGESTMALAGGAGMILTPSTIMPMVSLGFLSKDGKCYTFDSRANGYGRGEGVGVVVLKRLKDAIRDNDTIRGVIRGTATNQDGRTSGITMPSSEAQVANIRKCYASAGLEVDETMFVECHGTGTQAGDPRELKAISDALCNERAADKPMLVGSIKTNIGHLEGSAGVAGVIKAVMTVEKGRIPRHINFLSWNPDIDHRKLKVNIPLRNTPWPTSGLRRISVNSFGFGGSNAHAIIDDAAHFLETAETHYVAHHNTMLVDGGFSTGVDPKVQRVPPPYLLVFSANDQAGVARIADAHLSHLSRRHAPRPSLRDYAYTLFSRRSKLQYKAFAIAEDHDELMLELARVKASQPLRSPKSRALNIAFVFCGQGAQWHEMGKDLRIYEPFQDSFMESVEVLKDLDPNFNPLTTTVEITSPTPPRSINEPMYAQPTTTAVQIALVDLLTACGIRPAAVVGHSSGEIAAAYTAGMISKLDALKIAYFRGKAASQVPFKGSMLAASLSPAAAQEYVDHVPQGAVCVACINSPQSVTLSGDVDCIRQVQLLLTRDGVDNKLLVAETAYHSHHMLTVSGEYLAMLDKELPQPLANKQGPPMFSSVTGQRLSHNDLAPSYWVDNMVSLVRFDRALLSMMNAERAVRPDVFLEISPHSVFRKALKEIVAGTATGTNASEIPYFPTMVKNRDNAITALRTLGELWARGLPIQLGWLHEQRWEGRPKCLVDLPTYPWDHSKTYWHESHLSKAHRFRKFGSHDFLGAMTADSITPQEPRWRGFIDIAENPWIEHHRIQKKIMYPAAGMVVMAVEAAKQVVDGVVGSASDILDFEISEFKIEAPMVILEGETRLEYNFNATRLEESTSHGVSTWRYSFTIYSILDTASAPPYLHTASARGFFAVRFRPRGLGDVDRARSTNSFNDHPTLLHVNSTPVDFANGMNPREFYERLNIIGLNYDRLFRNITTMSCPKESPESQSTKYCWTKVRIPNTKLVMPEEYETPATIHPATLDAMFQSLFVLGDEPMVPHHIESIRISASVPQGAGTEFIGYSESKRKGTREAVSNIVMWHGEDREEEIVRIRGLGVITMATPGKAIPDFLPDHRNLCSQVVWKEDIHYDKPSDLRTFETMLELMGHRFPGLRVLQVGGDGSVVCLVFGILASGTTPRIRSYLVLAETDDALGGRNKASDQSFQPLPVYEQLTDKHNLAETLKQQKFDLILADSRMGIDRGVLIEALKPTGMLAFTHRDEATNGASGPADVISRRFKPATHQRDCIPASWYSLPQFDPSSLATQKVLILVDNDDEFGSETWVASLTDVLISSLEARSIGLDVQRMRLNDLSVIVNNATPESLDTFVISLLELNREKDIVFDIDAEHYVTIQKTFQKTNRGLLWVTAGAQMDSELPTKSPFLGWARTVRSEESDKQIVSLDLEAVNPHKRKRSDEEMVEDASTADCATAICDVFFRSFASELTEASREVEYAHRRGCLYIPRLEPLREANKLIEERLDQKQIVHEVHSDRTKSLKVVREASAAFDDVYFKEDPATNGELQPQEVLINVEECSLIPGGLDTYSADAGHAVYRTDVWGTVAKVGTEVTRVSPGQTVVAINCGAVATRVIADQRLVWRDQLPDSAFAHSPTCLITASCCLRVVTKGSKALIHGAASPHGQAAIQIAWIRGAEVYAVVSGDHERQAVIKGGVLDDRHLFDAGPGLPGRVAAVTGSKGMDYIFNPTASHRDLDFRMVRPYGQVIHLTQPGAPVEVAPSTGCFQLKTFDFGMLMEHCPERVAEHFDIVRDMSLSNIQAPVLEQRYPFAAVRAAFKDLKSDPLSGVRVLRRVATETKVHRDRKLRTEEAEILPFARIPRQVYPEARLSWYASYIVAGGLGGLGLDVVKWLADHGARHITILSRTRYHGKTAEDYLSALHERGVQIAVMEVDICDWESCSHAISLHGKIAGIIHAAAVVKDGIYPNLSHADWRLSTLPKTIGSYNLHRASLSLPEPLDFFIFLSSAAGIIGNPGQASYNAGNAFCDALARHRSARGLHSVSIDLGPVLGAGMVADDEALWDQLRAGGFIGVRLEDFHTVLERAIAVTKPMTMSDPPTLKEVCAAGEPQPFLCPPQVVMGVGTGGLVRQNKTANPFWTRTPLFSFLNLVDLPPGSSSLSSSSSSSPDSSASLKPALAATSSRAAAASLLLPHFVRALGEVMGKSHAATTIDPDSVLDDHGPDSLRTREVLDWIRAATGVKIGGGINQMPLRSICALVVEMGGFGGEE